MVALLELRKATDMKGAAVWSGQFWLNVFCFLRQLPSCSQR